MAKKITVPAAEEQQSIQEKVVLYQLLQKHMEELRQQLLILERKFLEVEITKQTLADIQNIEKDNETLVSLGTGCYAFGRFINSKKILMDIGSGVLIKKPITSATLTLDSKRQEIEDLNKTLQKEISNVTNKMNEIAVEIEKIQKK